MDLIHFNEKMCEKIRRYFDSYLDNELLVETNHEVLGHLSACPDCRKVLDARARLRQTVKSAVEKETAPASLLASVRSTIRRRRSFFNLGIRQWAMAAVAIAVLVAGGVIALRTGNFFAPVMNAGRDSLELMWRLRD